MSTAENNGFDFLDSAEDRQNGRFPIAKGIFSVMSTDPTASNIFNGGVMELAARSQEEWASAVANQRPDLQNYTRYLEDAVTLKGLSDVGIHNAVEQMDLNSQEKVHAEWAMKKAAWDNIFGVGSNVVSTVPGVGGVSGPLIGLTGMAFENTFVGPEPKIDWSAQELPNMDIGDASTQSLNALKGVNIDISGLDDFYYDDNGRVLDYNAISPPPDIQVTSRGYKDEVNDLLRSMVGDRVTEIINNDVTARYNNVTEDIDPAPPRGQQ
jgi:hypothetical protein